MPAETVERLAQREERLTKSAAKVGDGDAGRSRTLGKRLKRAQRKRRRLTKLAQRGVKKAEGGKE
jgi:hypothetical protein